MAWEHEKSVVTICLDIFRHLLIIAGTCYAVFFIWKLNWIIALIAAIPVYIVILNLCGFITLPLYAFTPENRLKTKAFRSYEKSDFERGKAFSDEFTEKFNVKVPEESEDNE
jgi:hypothetical protein